MSRRRCGLCGDGWGQTGAVRVLVVEDELRMARALRRGLITEGFAVDLAHDGVTGLELARDSCYDAVVLDIMLPQLSGYRVVQQLRVEGNRVPVLILSAKDGEWDQADGLDLGADDYLTKPFSFVVLVAKLRALLRRGGSQLPVVLRAGDLALDPARHEVTRSGSPVELSAREFALLDYLMRHVGQVSSRNQLLQHVWDAPDHVDANVVEVYIGYLRRKLDRAGAPSVIQTVRGVGYRLLGA